MEDKKNPQQKTLDAAGHTPNHDSSTFRENTHPRSHWEKTIKKRTEYKLEGGRKQDAQGYQGSSR